MENSAPQDAQNNVLLAERLFVLLRLTQLEKEIIHTLRPLYVCWFLLICALFVVRVWRELQHINTPFFVVALCGHLSKVFPPKIFHACWKGAWQAHRHCLSKVRGIHAPATDSFCMNNESIQRSVFVPLSNDTYCSSDREGSSSRENSPVASHHGKEIGLLKSVAAGGAPFFEYLSLVLPCPTTVASTSSQISCAAVCIPTNSNLVLYGLTMGFADRVGRRNLLEAGCRKARFPSHFNSAGPDSYLIVVELYYFGTAFRIFRSCFFLLCFSWPALVLRYDDDAHTSSEHQGKRGQNVSSLLYWVYGCYFLSRTWRNKE